eukprot:3905099-Amphidinium_carterae.1
MSSIPHQLVLLVLTKTYFLCCLCYHQAACSSEAHSMRQGSPDSELTEAKTRQLHDELSLAHRGLEQEEWKSRMGTRQLITWGVCIAYRVLKTVSSTTRRECAIMPG